MQLLTKIQEFFCIPVAALRRPYFHRFLSDIYTNGKLDVGIFGNFESRDTGLNRIEYEPTKDGTIALREWNHV